MNPFSHLSLPLSLILRLTPSEVQTLRIIVSSFSSLLLFEHTWMNPVTIVYFHYYCCSCCLLFPYQFSPLN